MMTLDDNPAYSMDSAYEGFVTDQLSIDLIFDLKRYIELLITQCDKMMILDDDPDYSMNSACK